MSDDVIIEIQSIEEVNEILGLPKPKNPFLSFIRYRDVGEEERKKVNGSIYSINSYMIILKEGVAKSLRFDTKGEVQQTGSLAFVKPYQLIGGDVDYNKELSCCEWVLFLASDFVEGTRLCKIIDSTHFFSYENRNAFFVNNSEKRLLTSFVAKIEEECRRDFDSFTKEILLVNTEGLLNYSKRYCGRQQLPKRNVSNSYVAEFENFLGSYYDNPKWGKGIPTVKHLSKQLGVSSTYLNRGLKQLTGKTVKEQIDLYVLKKAKNKLLRTRLNISEISYQLGFAYPNHFSKFFKLKTGLSPKEFRKQMGYEKQRVWLD